MKFLSSQDFRLKKEVKQLHPRCVPGNSQPAIQAASPISLNFEFMIFKQEFTVLNLELNDRYLLSYRAAINWKVFELFQLKWIQVRNTKTYFSWWKNRWKTSGHYISSKWFNPILRSKRFSELCLFQINLLLDWDIFCWWRDCFVSTSQI